MDTRSGQIWQRPEDAPIESRPYLKQMTVEPTPAQLRRGFVGRNECCPCGSGKKFKKCCKVEVRNGT